MKANRKYVQAEEAVSPVIAVILMVAITVVLAATVFVLVGNIGGDTETPPSVVLSVKEDSANDRILIKSVSGETLRNSTYQVSVTLGADSNPSFIICDFDLEAGGQIIVNTETDAGSLCEDGISGPEVSNGLAITAPEDYHVVVRHVTSQSTLVDKNVEIV